MITQENIVNNKKEKVALPIRVLQFGEGNFLRAFADWVIDTLNEKADFNTGVAVAQPIQHGMTDVLAAQAGQYHHLIRGIQKGKQVNDIRLVNCIQQSINPFETPEALFDLAKSEELEFVISNTTEAGIQFKEEAKPEGLVLAETFPGKLTQLLKIRFDYFNGDESKGLILIPCELIEQNGDTLKACIISYAKQWNLGEDFVKWIENSNHFCNTLVDRIVPGYPKDELAQLKDKLTFDDKLVVASEVFHLWVIEASQYARERFPADKFGLNVVYTDDITPYRTRKVRILNGAHTSMVPVGLLSGIETVRESMEDKVVGDYIRKAMLEEIAPTIDLPKQEIEDFAHEVMERFLNPFIRHELKSISLNSVSKYKVRVLPTVKDYYQSNGKLPQRLVLALACLIKLYLSDDFQINDNEEVKVFFGELKKQAGSVQQITEKVLSNTEFWEENLLDLGNMSELVSNFLTQIAEKGITETLQSIQS
ncbi:tagaturonate reductase [Limibacter armeniacum]|uniref:tagaturonate reductase n=1 Tax=Limibacter armeniacum TaxID=466084 RepID=UPI002FE5AF4E